MNSRLNDKTLHIIKAVLRRWLALHPGKVLTDGYFRNADLICFLGEGRPMTYVNEKKIRTSGFSEIIKVNTHDLAIQIKKGDTIGYCPVGSCHTSAGRVTRDTVITYVDNIK